MKTWILSSLAVGSVLGFMAAPALATAGITMFGFYMTMVMVLLGCNLVEQ
jgi:maltodextrin utilization protein YvdJ